MDTDTGANGYAPLGQAPEHLSAPRRMGIDTDANGYAPLGQAPEHLSTPWLLEIDTGLMETPLSARHSSTSRHRG